MCNRNPYRFSTCENITNEKEKKFCTNQLRGSVVKARKNVLEKQSQQILIVLYRNFS